MGARTTTEHYMGDLTSDILAGSKSSRLYNRLVVDEKKFSSISSYITASLEDGLILISGNLDGETTFEEAESLIWDELNKLVNSKMDAKELTKVKNKHKTSKVFSEQSLLNRVMNIAFFENMGCLDEINDELGNYDRITREDIHNFAIKTFKKSQQSILHVKIKTNE